jgi:DNA-binding NtrC family response regulator
MSSRAERIERCESDGAALRLLIAEEDPALRDLLAATLARLGFVIAAPAGVAPSLAALAEQEFDIVILDVGAPRGPALDTLQRLRDLGDDAEIIVVMGRADEAVDSVAGPLDGAYCITRPFPLGALVELVKHAARHRRLRRESRVLRRAVTRREPGALILGQSDVIAGVRALVERAARSRSHVLIQGESGSGKALAARAIHEGGPRGDLPFLAVDCRMATERLEPELFGREGGAESKVRCHGLLELAHEGTLFLEEAGALSPATQAKLLRAIDRGEIRRVGGKRTIHVDVRIVAAASQDLGPAVARDEFRADLYYRLGAMGVRMPPLRDRVEDIPLLVEHLARGVGQRPSKLSSEALAVLGRYPWPGNVRELRAVVERLGMLTSSEEVTPAEVALHLPDASAEGDDVLLSLDELERRHILRVLHRTGLNRARAAKILGVDPKTLYNKLKSYDDAG